MSRAGSGGRNSADMSLYSMPAADGKLHVYRYRDRVHEQKFHSAKELAILQITSKCSKKFA